MSLLINYISDFKKRAGNYVFLATIFSRILSFIASWIALQLLHPEPLGNVLYAWNFIVFLTPLVGLGLHQSYIRYGALTKNPEEREQLFKYVIRKGTVTSLILSLVVILLSYLYDFKNPNIKSYLYILSFVFIPTFLIEIIKVRVRLEHQNKKLALIEVVYNIVLIISVLVLSYFWKTTGYAFSFVITPLLSSLLFYKLLLSKILKPSKPNFINLEFWRYGVFGGLSNVVTLLLFSIDILLIGNILNEPEKVTIYRYLTLIPFSLLFLPRVFITTDFVSFTEKIADVNYIKKYTKGYLLLFTIISVIICFSFYLFGEFILDLFDTSFKAYHQSFFILTFGVCGILILRGLYGNLLSSIGQVKINFYITSIAVLLNYFSNQILIPKYGVKGAAITTASLMWLTGLATLCSFYFFYRKYLSTLK
ncbi:oligosaccharide flippase family protein [Tenacibaculum sp. MEBiC06402]|uniref:oligosaccharide flippase family protein n=1 Tax=unclassified Tenacibaculum TaxID=2635139 RepID=UPI003B9C6B9F